MKRYYVRLRATPVKHHACFICGDARHADLALDFGKSKLHVARVCLEAIGVVVSLVGEEALRSFAGTVLGNLASVALGNSFGPQLQQFGNFVTGAKLIAGEKKEKRPKPQVIDVEYEVIPTDEDRDD